MKKQVNVLLEEDMIKEIKQFGTDNDKSFSGIVREALNFYLRTYNPKESVLRLKHTEYNGKF